MSEIQTNNKNDDQIGANKTWGDRMKSSILIGLVFSVVWIVLMLVTGSYHPLAGGHQGAADMSGLLANALFWFFAVTVFAFIIKSIWHFLKKPRA